MRLLLVTPFYSTHGGGVEASAHRLADALLARMPDLDIEWMASDCDAVPAALADRLRCTPAPCSNTLERRTGVSYPRWSVGALKDLWRAVRRADAVHIHESVYLGSVFAYLFARRQGKPILVTQHVGAIPFDRRILRAMLGLLNRSVGRMVLAGAERVFFISPAVRDYYSRFCSFRATPAYVPNGVDKRLYAFSDAASVERLKRAAGRDPGRPLCLFVGRFVERKGVPLLLSLARALPQVDWILAGDGVLRPEEAGLPNVSVIRGRSGVEIAALYRMADLLVLPSSGEGFPLVVQEAMACGTPVLVGEATAEGAPAMRTFLFTAALDLPDASQTWARRVGSLLSEPRLRAMRPELAAAARAQWSWDAAALAYSKELTTWAKGSSGQPPTTSMAGSGNTSLPPERR